MCSHVNSSLSWNDRNSWEIFPLMSWAFKDKLIIPHVCFFQFHHWLKCLLENDLFNMILKVEFDEEVDGWCQKLSSLEHDISWHKWVVSSCHSYWTCGHLCHAIVSISDLNSPLFTALDNNKNSIAKALKSRALFHVFNLKNSFSHLTVSGSRQTIHRPILYNVSDIMCLFLYWIFSSLIEGLSKITLTKSIMRQRKTI